LFDTHKKYKKIFISTWIETNIACTVGETKKKKEANTKHPFENKQGVHGISKSGVFLPKKNDYIHHKNSARMENLIHIS